jgi:predicted nucleotide-binding protein (sugar kinase/HSP70/actin superfamily)
MFAYHKDEESLNELKEVWLEHVRKKLSEEVEKVWKEKNMTNEMLEELLNTHIRTPYK